jgi:glutamate-1-semialdehyde 2,1-aminomutase
MPEQLFDFLPSSGLVALSIALGALLLVLLLHHARRLWVTLAARAWTPGVARVLARLVRSRDSDESRLVSADGAPTRFIEARRCGLHHLRYQLAERAPKSHAWAEGVRGSLSDLRFSDASRVPFPFARVMRDGFNLAAVATASHGSRLCDLDDNWSLDVSGSYGVNLAGYDRYKEWLDNGWERVRDLGPVLGPLHPLVADNVAALKRISGLDEVSFHASGTEAVMAAVRLARFNTRRKLVLCFSGAYHGWWDGVQPGLGSERSIEDCLTVKDMSPAVLKLIAVRGAEIAAVLVNPVQAFHPNSPPPNDAILLNSEVRRTEQGTSPYGRWLRELRAVCTAAGVPLIFDEVFSGFRLAAGGAQAAFEVQADMVCYGKTVAGGMPIGVVCGRHELMRRYDPEHPMRMAYVVGTFAAHPLTMGAMAEFLKWISTPAAVAELQTLNVRTARWASETSRALQLAGLPVTVTSLGSIWTLQFTAPSRYNWLLQYYLRAEGVNLSWVGTGRCMFNLDFNDFDLRDLRTAIITAATRMRADKWWLDASEHPEREKDIKSELTRDMLAAIVQPPRALQSFYHDVMRRKHDDHVASHSDRINQLLHLLSSATFIFCYWLVFSDLVTAMWLGLAALFVRQLGHALIEPPCHDKEQLLLGFDTRSKTRVVGIYLLIPLVNVVHAGQLELATLPSLAATVAQQWFAFTALVVFGHVARLTPKHGLRNALIWLVKLVTDPITDIFAYYPTLVRFARRV